MSVLASLCQHNVARSYSTETSSLVDITGNFPFFATFSVTTHEADALGAFSLVPIIDHGPDSLHVFFPDEIDEISHDNGMFEFFLTTDFFTVKPGRAINFKGTAATWPVAVLEEIVNV